MVFAEHHGDCRGKVSRRSTNLPGGSKDGVKGLCPLTAPRGHILEGFFKIAFPAIFPTLGPSWKLARAVPGTRFRA